MNTTILWDAINAFSGRVAGFAWDMLWQSSLLILLLFAVDGLFKRRLRASVRYALWLLVVIKMLLPPSFAIPSSVAWWLRPRSEQPSAIETRTRVEVRYVQKADRSDLRLPAATVAGQISRVSAATLGLMCSLGGTAALLWWIVTRQRQVSTLLAKAVDAPPALQAALIDAKLTVCVHPRVRLLVTAKPISPALCGLVHPVIVLPEVLANNSVPSQVRAVLLHELAHLKRGDLWVNSLQSLLQVVYWWHPLFWLANARIGRVREEAVDDRVVSALGEESPGYAPTLLEVARLTVARNTVAAGLLGIIERPGSLHQRIKRLLDSTRPASARLGFASMLCIAAVGALALPMGPAPGSPPVNTPTNTVGLRRNGTDGSTLGFDWYLGNMLMAKTSDTPSPPVAAQVHVEEIQVNTKIRAAQVAAQNAAEFWSGIPLQNRSNKVAVLNADEACRQLARLAALALPREIRPNMPPGVPGEVTQGSVTTLPGRQAQIQIIEVMTVASAVAARERAGAELAELLTQYTSSHPKVLAKQEQIRQLDDRIRNQTASAMDNNYVTNLDQVPVGLTVDLQPDVAPDGFTFNLKMAASYTQFLGYDDPGAFVPQAVGDHTPTVPIAATLPLPHFRIRRIDWRTLPVANGETLVVGDSIEVFTSDVGAVKGDLPLKDGVFRREPSGADLILFITPTLINPAGEPIHKPQR